jgi:hypothetical protein
VALELVDVGVDAAEIDAQFRHWWRLLILKITTRLPIRPPRQRGDYRRKFQ